MNVSIHDIVFQGIIALSLWVWVNSRENPILSRRIER